MDIAKIRKKLKEESEKGRKDKEMPQTESPGEPSVRPEAEINEQKPEEAAADSAVESREAMHQPEQRISSEAIKKKDTEEPVAADEQVELLAFHMSDEEFAFRISDIEEILRYQRITFVPRMPDYVLGITSLRGKIIPVVDLRKRLSIIDDIETNKSRLKILILKGPKGPTEAELVFMEGVVLHKNKFISVIRMEEVMDPNLKIKLKE